MKELQSVSIGGVDFTINSNSFILPLGEMETPREITSITDGGNDTILVTCVLPHNFLVGETVRLTYTYFGTYDGTSEIIWKDTYTFKVNAFFDTPAGQESGTGQIAQRYSPYILLLPTTSFTKRCALFLGMSGASTSDTYTLTMGLKHNSQELYRIFISKVIPFIGAEHYLADPLMFINIEYLGLYNKVFFKITSSNSGNADIGVSVKFKLFDVDKSLDVSTILENSPMSESSIAELILSDASTPLENNSNGEVSISSLSTTVKSDIAGVISAANVATVSDLSTTKLAPDGLDNILLTAPTGVANNFREAVVQLWRRFFKKVTKNDSNYTIKTYADNGTTIITTQTFSEDSSIKTVGDAI